MRHIHPFPARMAPEIALHNLASLKPGQKVLDPMTGSGMVISQAARKGIHATGVDLDPLAVLISNVGSNPVARVDVEECLKELLRRCNETSSKTDLPWIDGNQSTKDFVEFWFASKQRDQLRKLSYHLIIRPPASPDAVLNLLKVALSRLIITKEPKASLARDCAHSRPHRTIERNDFDIFEALGPSVNHVLKALDSPSIKVAAKATQGDARKLSSIESNSIDLVVTSPPYLNAIDYMRGHRLSLVWLGYRLDRLTRIRANTIGAERAKEGKPSNEFAEIVEELGLDELETKNKRMLDRFFSDLKLQTREAFRILKENSRAIYVIGNSSIKGTYIENSKILQKAGELAGFEVIKDESRDIPNNRRYMPIMVAHGNSLAKRMRSEHVITFEKKSS